MKRILPFKEFEALDKLQAELNSIPIVEFEDPLDGLVANDIANEITERLTSLNEALSSNFLRSILDGMPSYGRKRSDADFARALYSSYKIALNDVQDSDFIHHGDPSIAFSSASKSKDNSLFFMMCDRQETIDRLNGTRGKIPNPFVVAIIKNGKGLMLSRASDPKITISPRPSSYGRMGNSAQKGSDRYGWLSDDGNAGVGYALSNFQGRESGISVSRDSVLSIATFALELDLDAFIARQGTTADVRKERYAQKQDVLIWKPGNKKELDAIRQGNLDRRKAMLGAKVSIEDLFSIYSQTDAMVDAAINKYFHGGNIPTNPAEAAKAIGVGSETRSWTKVPDFIDSGLRDLGNVMSNTLSTLRDAMRFCYEYYDKAQRVDNLANCLEAGKVPDDKDQPTEVDLTPDLVGRLKRQIEYYSAAMGESLKDLVTYKSYMLRFQNEANQIISKAGV